MFGALPPICTGETRRLKDRYTFNLKNPGWVLLAYSGNFVVRYSFSAFITEHNQVDSGD